MTVNISYLKYPMFLVVSGFFLLTQVHAGIPVWTFSAPNPTSVIISNGGTATVQYTVTNHSNQGKNLILAATSGLSASTCVLPTKDSTCTLTLTVDGNAVPQQGIHAGPILCEQGNPNQCYQPSPANVLNITKSSVGTANLQASVSELVLSVTGLTEYGVPTVGQSTNSGVARIITITNTGTNPATDVTYTPLPSGTGTISPANCGTIAPAGTCVLTITPGATPSAAPGDLNPTPITLNVSGSNTNTLNITLNILTYGSVYQGGFVFDVDDTQGCSGSPSVCTGSIGGKVMTTTNQATTTFHARAPVVGAFWSSNGAGIVTYDIIPFIGDSVIGTNPDYTTALLAYNSIYPSYTSTHPFPSPNAFSSCDGSFDGLCNRSNIFALYALYTTDSINHTISSGATSTNTYAAGLCSRTINSYSDWYLPAICQMGYNGIIDNAGCGTNSSPSIQNIQSSLIDIANLGAAPAGASWSSTEYSNNARSDAWYQSFASSGSFQSTNIKINRYSVYCVRNFTH